MNCIARRILPAFLLCVCLLTFVLPARAQDASVAPRPAISVLDSTKEQDGLVGSVRRVKIETAKIEFKDGRPVEGPPQLVEVTTYGIKGNRIENTSYPNGGSLVGKEEYKYDERGNITEMTVRDNRGAILSREAYSYEFDKFGNWTKMVTSLIVFENGQLQREPTEVTYRTFSYYFDENIARIVDESKVSNAPVVPEPASFELRDQQPLRVDARRSSVDPSLELAAEPPPLAKRLKTKSAEPLKAEPFKAEPFKAEPFKAEPLKAEPVKSVESEPTTASAPEMPKVSDAKVANDLYLAGRSRFDSGDAPGAIESYLQSIKLEPKSAEVHLNLGHAYLMMQKDREAIKAFKESIKFNSKVAETHYGLGFSNFRMGRFRDAADAFKKATTLDPGMAKAHYGLSLSYQELGMTSALLDEYRILERLDKSLARKLVQTFPQFNFSCRLVQGCP